MSEYPELQRQLNELVLWRTNRITEAERTIKEVNSIFDERALEIKRQIQHLEAQDTRPPPAPRKTRAEFHLVGLTDDEIVHYRQLQRRGK